MLGKLPVSLQAGVGDWLAPPEMAAEGFRFRLQANFVLPKFYKGHCGYRQHS